MQKKSAELVVPSVSWSGAATPLKSNISPSALLRSYPVPLGKAVPDRGDVRVMANVGKPEAIQKRACGKHEDSLPDVDKSQLAMAEPSASDRIAFASCTP
jgi:hypothetical protein